MRIGILTLPLHTNYGGILQAYALQMVLERMGHEVVVFDTSKKATLPPWWKLPLCYVKRLIKKCMGAPEQIFEEQYRTKMYRYIAQNILPFIEEHIHRKVIDSFEKLKPEDVDSIIVGSDQVWRTIYYIPMWRHQPIETAYLSFAKEWNIKRVSYAASFGTDNWEYNAEQTQNCRQLLQKFDSVSVREDNAVKLCEKYFQVDALHVLDPTMLLNSENYVNLFLKKNTPKSAGSLLNYVLDSDDNITEFISKVSNQMHLTPFAVNNPFENDETKPLDERVKPSIETWLRGFYDAEFVITDSFHACVFSIIFKKQFVVIGNKERGMSRFESLLKIFGLQDRLVTLELDITRLQPIDYAKVYDKYGKLKDKSLAFLFESLK